MEWTLDYSAFALLLVSALLGFKVKQRKFERTNEFGVGRFPTFAKKVKARSTDYLIGATSIALLVAGTIMLASSHVDTWGWVVMIPVCLFMLFLLLGA